MLKDDEVRLPRTGQEHYGKKAVVKQRRRQYGLPWLAQVQLEKDIGYTLRRQNLHVIGQITARIFAVPDRPQTGAAFGAIKFNGKNRVGLPFFTNPAGGKNLPRPE